MPVSIRLGYTSRSAQTFGNRNLIFAFTLARTRQVGFPVRHWTRHIGSPPTLEYGRAVGQHGNDPPVVVVLFSAARFGRSVGAGPVAREIPTPCARRSGMPTTR